MPRAVEEAVRPSVNSDALSGQYSRSSFESQRPGGYYAQGGGGGRGAAGGKCCRRCLTCPCRRILWWQRRQGWWWRPGGRHVARLVVLCEHTAFCLANSDGTISSDTSRYTCIPTFLHSAETGYQPHVHTAPVACQGRAWRSVFHGLWKSSALNRGYEMLAQRCDMMRSSARSHVWCTLVNKGSKINYFTCRVVIHWSLSIVRQIRLTHFFYPERPKVRNWNPMKWHAYVEHHC